MQDNPYAAPAPGAALADDQPTYAGFWWRVLAQIIDSLIFIPVGVVSLANTYLWHSAALAIVLQLPWIVYRLVLDSTGGTVGKRAIRLRLVDAQGRPPGARRALLRNIHYVTFSVAMMALRPLGVTGEHAITMSAEHPTLPPGDAAVGVVVWAYCLLMLVTVVFVAARSDKRGLHDLWSGVWCLRLPPSREVAAPAAV